MSGFALRHTAEVTSDCMLAMAMPRINHVAAQLSAGNSEAAKNEQDCKELNPRSMLWGATVIAASASDSYCWAAAELKDRPCAIAGLLPPAPGASCRWGSQAPSHFCRLGVVQPTNQYGLDPASWAGTPAVLQRWAFPEMLMQLQHYPENNHRPSECSRACLPWLA